MCQDVVPWSGLRRAVVAATTRTFDDAGCTADTAYVYRLKAVHAGVASRWSASDLALTTMFLDHPIVAGSTIVQAAHSTQLRTAIDAVLMRKDRRVLSVDELPQMEPPATAEEKRPQEVRTPVAHAGSETWTTGSYSYDGSGNIRSMGSDTFVYDAFGRLTSGAAGTERRQDYTYDRFGNLTSIKTIVTGQPDVQVGLNASTVTNRTGLGTLLQAQPLCI